MRTEIRILQGHQIGGCITIISTESTMIVIDFGESLPGSNREDDIEFDWDNEKVDAVFFTHYHGDHIGRFMEIPEDVPIYMGEVTRAVMINIRNALKKHNPDMERELYVLENRNNINYLNPNKEIRIGDITVTPYSVDHSAYDAYMFLVKANDEYILHTGDYRDHGHRGHIMGKNGEDRNIILEVISKYVLDNGRRKINALITEGTMMTRFSDKEYSEKQMLLDAKEYFASNRYIFLKVSSTNVDSLASFAKAAAANGMKMYVSSYLMNQIEVYRKAGKEHRTNMYSFENVLPLMPNPNECYSDLKRTSAEKQRYYMKKNGFVVVLGDESVIDEFSSFPIKAIYSMWSGYLKENTPAFDKKLYDFHIKTNAKIMHTSGHAYPRLIAEVINMVNPTEAIIPIHSEAVEEFYNLDIKDETFSSSNAVLLS